MSITELFNSPTFRALLATLETEQPAAKVEEIAMQSGEPAESFLDEIREYLELLYVELQPSRRQMLAMDATGVALA